MYSFTFLLVYTATSMENTNNNNLDNNNIKNSEYRIMQPLLIPQAFGKKKKIIVLSKLLEKLQEPVTKLSLGELIEGAKKDNRSVILAAIKTELNKTIQIHYFELYALLRYFWKDELTPKNTRYNKPTTANLCFQKNPINNLSIIDSIGLYKQDEEENKFNYIGSDYILHHPGAHKKEKEELEKKLLFNTPQEYVTEDNKTKIVIALSEYAKNIIEKEPEKAIKYYNKIIKLKPSRDLGAIAQYLVGLIYKKHLNNHVEAISGFSAAVAYNELDEKLKGKAFLSLCKLSLLLNKEEDAKCYGLIAYLNSNKKIEAKSTILLAKAFLRDKHNYGYALSFATNALNQDHNQSIKNQAQLLLGLIHYKIAKQKQEQIESKHHLNEAQKYAEKSLKTKKEKTEAQCLLIKIETARKNFKEALKLTSMIENSISSTQVAPILYQRAKTYLKIDSGNSNFNQQAIADLKKVIEKNTHPALTFKSMAHIADIFYLKGKVEEAEDLSFSVINNKDKENPIKAKSFAYKTLASIYYAKENVAVAELYASHILESSDSEKHKAFAHLLIGMINNKRSEHIIAQQHLKKAAMQTLDLEVQKEALKWLHFYNKNID